MIVQRLSIQTPHHDHRRHTGDYQVMQPRPRRHDTATTNFIVHPTIKPTPSRLNNTVWQVESFSPNIGLPPYHDSRLRIGLNSTWSVAVEARLHLVLRSTSRELRDCSDAVGEKFHFASAVADMKCSYTELSLQRVDFAHQQVCCLLVERA